MKNLNKITKTFLLTFGFISFNVLAQNISTQVPNQIPPTPETFKFTKYGDIPVNESSGNASLDIPLYNFKAGRVNVPISIFHGGGAVKVDDTNTWTGINWQLNAGGLISRTVNDEIDENTNAGDRIFYSSEALSTFRVNQSPELAFLSRPGVDSEVDIFNYNFPGYSGSFYLDENFIPRLIKYDKEIKIELSANAVINGITTHDKKTITITTPDGTKYFFGGADASETTRIRSRAMDFSTRAQTGFHLFKIENPFGDIVSFVYKIVGTTSLIGYSERFTVDTEVTTCGPALSTHTSGPQAANIESSGKLLLLTITSNRDNSKVDFDSALQPNNTVQYVLNNILIYDYKVNLRRKIAFDFITPNTINTLYKRFYLEKINIFEGTNTVTDNIHSFEYNNPELLPDRFSKAQDYAGYYNGKIYNSTYLPKTNNTLYADYQSGWADKSVVFDTTLYGSLKKVTYPTKGFTTFEYETGIDNTTTVYGYEDRYLNIYHNDPPRPDRHSSSASSISLDLTEFDDSQLNEPTQTSNLNPSVPITVRIVGDFVGAVTQHHYMKFTLDDMDSTNDIVDVTHLTTAVPEQSYDFTRTFSNLNPLGRYEFRLEYYSNVNLTIPTFNVTAHVKFGSKIPINYKPGIRIKKIRSYTDVNSTPLITRYYYNKVAYRFKGVDSQVQIRMPNYEGDSMIKGCCEVNGMGMLGTYTVNQKYIQSDVQNNLYSANSSIYQYVTTSYGGDNFENGGKESQFFVQADYPMHSLTYIDGNYASIKKETNASLKNGTVLNEIYFSSNATFSGLNGGAILSGKLKEITNTYLEIPDKCYAITNCMTSAVSNIGCPSMNTPTAYYVDNFYFGYYYTYSKWHTLEKTITKEYLTNGIVQNTTNYLYDSKLAGLPSKIVKTGIDTFATEYLYPNDVLTEPSMMSLKNQNRIDQPIYVKNYKNNSLLTTQKTNYEFEDSSLSSIFILPSSIQTLKGGNNNLPLEDRVVFHRYDNKGNLSEFSSGSIYTVYIWGYNKTQLVAKIENAIYSSIPANLITDIENASSSTGSESALTIALNNLRTSSNLKDAMITTYTYLPLIGVSTITDPKGYTLYYDYDANGRLEIVKEKDAQGNFNTLSENKYNYRP